MKKIIKIEEELLHHRECAYHVTLEASIQRCTKTDASSSAGSISYGNHAILHLRNYKFNLPADRPRYYLLYTPNGTLEDFIRCYKVCDQYIPQLFVWHVVHELAKAMLALNQPIHQSSLARADEEFKKDSWILHLDVKPGNIFFGYPQASDEELNSIYDSFQIGSASAKVLDPIQSYPSIKLGDFDLSEIENDDGPIPGRGGTPTFFPIEQMIILSSSE
jgi:serine/threonine protein kinase